jgi:hypothetical protein
MSTIYDINEKMNNIRVKLYPNYLPGVEGDFIARNESDTPLSIEDVCAHMKNRAGFTGSYQDAVDYVRQFLNEALYQLCNGKAVNLDYFSIHSNVGGTFNSAHEAHDHAKNPVTFRFRCRKTMRKLARDTGVVITAMADTKAYISEFTDVNTEAVNEIIMPREQFAITGHKIKVAGDDPSCGVYFESVEDDRRVKVQGRLAENSATRIIGLAPMLVLPRNYRVVIISQYTGSGTFLKTPRVITSGFTLEAA